MMVEGSSIRLQNVARAPLASLARIRFRYRVSGPEQRVGIPESIPERNTKVLNDKNLITAIITMYYGSHVLDRSSIPACVVRSPAFICYSHLDADFFLQS